MLSIRPTWLSLLLVVCLSAPGRPQGSLLPLPQETPAIGMNTPALSPDGKTICFSYLGDLWTVPTSGGVATRLTVNVAYDGWPKWSPDGQWIAFSSDRESSFEVYVIPAEGGKARQMTYHSANAYPTGWSPDGKRIIMYSIRDAEGWRIYSLDVATGATKTLTHDGAFMDRWGVCSPDGSSIAYDRSAPIAVWWRPKYRGSASMRIYTRNLTTGKVSRVTSYNGQCIWPMYTNDGKHIICSSDWLTPGVPNLISVPADGGRPMLLTRLHSDEVRWPSMSANGKLIVFERDGALYTVPSAGGQPRKVNIVVRSDDKQNNLLRLHLATGATEAEISPDGKTLGLVIRGDIWTLPTSDGEAKDIVSGPANDHDIWWSPDSSRIAFISDRAGNFNVYTVDVKSGKQQRMTTSPHDEGSPLVSPDGKSLSFLRSGSDGGLYVMNLDGSGTPRRVAESEGNNLFGVGITSYSWSPDSKWLAFTRRDPLNTQDVWIVPVDGSKRPVNVTYYPGDNSPVRWTPDGKYLIFTSDRDNPMGDLYCLPLEKPKAPAEEKKPQPAKPQPGKPVSEEPGTSKPVAANPEPPKKPVEVKIDFDGIDNRAKRITTQGVITFDVTPDSKAVVFVTLAGGAPDYWRVPVDGGTVTRLTTGGVGGGPPRFASDPNKFYALATDGTLRAVTVQGAGAEVATIAFSARMEVDRRAELHQAFNEFWRRIDVGFYDPKMHGVDWAAVRKRYEPLLAGVATKEEFAMFLLSEMIGELNASHSEVTPAAGPKGPQVAELGLTFDESYSGPGLKVAGYLPKGPDDEEGALVKPGEYVMQIDGTDVSWTETMWQTLYDKAGKTVDLLVNDKPVKDGARTVKLKAVDLTKYYDLVYGAKVKRAQDEVTKLSGGRLAYIHIKAMDAASMKQMDRQLWGKAQEADGLVLDVRDNGGGNTHDTILSQLSRVPYAYTVPRDGPRSTQPYRHWGKPIVLLMDQTSASDAEVFPSGFRALKLGKIVGMPTPGYVIGTYDAQLVDGTRYRIPMWGWYTLSGKDMENRGAKPDIEVDNTPEDLAEHRDRELETAVSVLLKELPGKK